MKLKCTVTYLFFFIVMMTKLLHSAQIIAASLVEMCSPSVLFEKASIQGQCFLKLLQTQYNTSKCVNTHHKSLCAC